MSCSQIFATMISSAMTKYDIKDNLFAQTCTTQFALPFPNLQRVDISDNRLKGNVPIDPTSASMSNLQYFDCSGNQFTGVVSSIAPLGTVRDIGFESLPLPDALARFPYG